MTWSSCATGTTSSDRARISEEPEYIETTATDLPEDQAKEAQTVIDKLEETEDVQEAYRTLA